MISFSLELAPQTDAELRDLVVDALASAIEEGGDEWCRGLSRVVSNWTDQPTFKASDAKTTGDGSELEITVDDQRFGWIDEGTAPVTIDGPRMVFPFQGRGTSYSAKTDGGTGQRIGPTLKTNRITDRSIAPRDLSGRAIDEELDGGNAVFIRIEQAING